MENPKIENMAIMVFPKLPYYHKCPDCEKYYIVSEENFYLYANGKLVNLRCKTCYKVWHKGCGKKNLVHKVSRKVKTLLSKVNPTEERHEALRTKMSKLGFKYLGSGASHMAFGKKDIVVKIEYNGIWRENMSQTDMEIANYQKVKANYSKNVQDLFLPILEYGENFMIVPYADIAHVEYEDINKLKAKLSRAGISPHDVREENVGIVKGKLCVIDYALCQIP